MEFDSVTLNYQELSKIKSFEDLMVWQKAHLLILDIYHITQKMPEEEKFGLTGQIRRASVSISTILQKEWGEILQRTSYGFCIFHEVL